MTKSVSMASMFSARVCRFLRATLAEVAAWAIVAISAFAVLDDFIRWISAP